MSSLNSETLSDISSSANALMEHIESHHHMVMAIHEIERRAASAHELGHRDAAAVLVAVANLLRARVPFPVSSGHV